MAVVSLGEAHILKPILHLGAIPLVVPLPIAPPCPVAPCLTTLLLVITTAIVHLSYE